MASEMLSIKTISEKWGLSTRRIGQLCNEGMIEGAVKIGGLWKIPADSRKPGTVRVSKTAAHIQTTQLLPCPVGITSYKEVSQECYYVDKTLLIKDVIDSHNKVTLFTRPRRFGKTLTMDMVRTFFEKSEEDTSIYFHGRKIWSCSDSYKTYQGAYPVIFISFKDALQSTWEEMYESLSMVIRDEYKRHINVLSSGDLSETDKRYFELVLNGGASEVELQSSLGRLSNMLSDAYGTRVVVIIDEYDTPVQQGYSNGYYKKIAAFMRNLFSSVLKDNAVLEFGILTGILRVAKESLFSGLNNIVVNTILDVSYSSYFGFTRQDVQEMADYYGHSDKLNEIQSWYDGYLFGNTEIYNPWSVINYFGSCKPKAFWSRTSGNDMILDIIRNGDAGMRDSLMELMQDHPVISVVDTDVIYPEISSSKDTVYSFLLMTGYLKVAETVSYLDDNPVCSMLIPNREIKGIFKKEILDNMSDTVGQPAIRDFRLALNSNNSAELQNTLRRYLMQSASSFDTAQENFYHGMMLGLLAIMSDDYIITSNRESGEGRYDIQLKPVSNSKPGMLMEFKAAADADEEKLSKLADEAVEQIRRKQYATAMKAEGISEIQLYGITFCNRKATVKTESI